MTTREKINKVFDTCSLGEFQFIDEPFYINNSDNGEGDDLEVWKGTKNELYVEGDDIIPLDELNETELEEYFDAVKPFIREKMTEKHGNIILQWPESQEIMDKKGMENHCALINDEIGLAMFGSAAYVVDDAWFSHIGEYEDMSEEEIENIVQTDWLKIAEVQEDEDGFEYYLF